MTGYRGRISGILIVLMGFGGLLTVSASADGGRERQCPMEEFCYCVRPEFKAEIDAVASNLLEEIAEARQDGRIVGYLSVPLSKGEGSSFSINLKAAGSIRDAVARRLGEQSVHLVNPGATNIRVKDQNADQGEYMYLWTQVLSRMNKDDALDFVYFAGPADFHQVTVGGDEGTGLVERLSAYFDREIEANERFRKEVERGDVSKDAFLRYYALKASAAFSRGAHDEWNIVRVINSKREIPQRVAVYFDGRLVEPGDFDDLVRAGNTKFRCAE